MYYRAYARLHRPGPFRGDRISGFHFREGVVAHSREESANARFTPDRASPRWIAYDEKRSLYTVAIQHGS